MKTSSPLPKRILLFLAGILLAVTVVLLVLCQRDIHSFRSLTRRIFVEELSDSTLNMHYTIAHPENFLPDGYRVLLPGYDRQQTDANRLGTENLLAALSSLHPDRMPLRDARFHRQLSRYLEQTLALNQFAYYSEPLSPSSGAQSQLPILLAEYTFRTEQDVEDYLALLEQTDDYFSSLLCYEREKAREGLLLPASSLEKVCLQCDTILTLADLKTGRHFLQTTFSERIKPLEDSGDITPEEAARYTNKNDRLLLEVLLPAYRSLREGLVELCCSDRPLTGLGAFPEGKAYYKALLVSETGSYRSIQEIETLLLDRLDAEYQTLRKLILEEPGAAALYLEEEAPAFPLSTTAEMIADLKQRMSSDFPAVPGDPPGVTVKPVQESLEAYCAPAFYLTSPLDDTDSNVIYINGRKTPKGLELYTTLAHEGFPGHLYQHVYANRRMLAEDDAPLGALLWYGGYLEGWALYTEFLSFDYASELFREAGREDAAILTQIEKHNRSMQLCLYSLLDLKIHYENKKTADIAPILSKYGITDSRHHTAIFNYIAEDPCNYPKYYLGYLEILSLQDTAKGLWQDTYSDLKFHTFLLDNGPADFLTLQERLTPEP